MGEIYHFRTQQGIENYTDEEAAEIVVEIEIHLKGIYTMPSNEGIILNGKCISK